jgi:hypothetical protein
VGSSGTSRYVRVVGLLCVVALLAFGADAHATGDINRSVCDNPVNAEELSGFQSFLPDCRAYELVTPPYKSGQPAFGVTHRPPPISTSGEKLLGIDFAGFAGTGNEENKGFEVGAIYTFARTATGWETEAIEPQASEASRSEFVTASPDLESSLWENLDQAPGEEVRQPSTRDLSFALRVKDATGGHFVTIGPKEPPAATHQREAFYKGASDDLTHVIYEDFASPGGLWPGDTTDEFEPSLYEYNGVEQKEPTLVGVRNLGALHGAVVNEQAELVSQCGTRLGSAGQGSTANAISHDGSVVYFSALECEEGAAGAGPEVTELYARRNQAETAAISEPAPFQCGACVTPASRALGRRSAVFEGASGDGSKSYFLTEQELLPGAKGESLFAYDWDRPAGDHVVLVASEVQGVSRISEDGSHVYFVATPALAVPPNLSLPAGHQAPAAGEPNLYVYDAVTGEYRFVATLSLEDETLWQHSDNSRPIDVTANGQYALFKSDAILTTDDSGAVPQLFEYDAAAETTIRVSRGQTSSAFPSGFGDNGNPVASPELERPKMLTTPQYQADTQPTAPRTGVSLAATGTAVFTSADALTPGAVRGRENVYEYRGENVWLVSPGDEASPLTTEESRLLGISGSGSDVYFFSTNQLLPQDSDTQADWYDAREGGGFAIPQTSPPCSAESCRQPIPFAPVLPLPGGSETTPGGDDVPPEGPKVLATPPPPKPPTRAQKLAKALKTCRKLPKGGRRRSCERHAQKLYGARRAPQKTQNKSRATKSKRGNR